MALPDLAGMSDLQVRGVDVDSTPERQQLAQTMLAVASAVVREAAGSPILETESTISWHARGGQVLDLPGQPVQSVSAVTLDGNVITDYTHDGGSLWRFNGWGYAAWGYDGELTPVTVTMVHGLPEVPEDIINLVCDVAILGMNTATEGAIDPRTMAERIDDYSVTFRTGAEAVASAVDLPRATRLRLRKRFGGTVGMVGAR